MGCILITGGQLFNKGAQAMTFTVVNEIKKRHPEKEIVLLSEVDFHRSEEDKNKYNFVIMPYSNRLKLRLAGGISGAIYKLINRLYQRKKIMLGLGKYEKKLKNLFSNADMVIDISGYGLSSQWRFQNSLFYLMNIRISKRYRVPMYILPQSFGPFDYKNILARGFLKFLMRKYLSYPSIIYARENEGFQGIKRFTRNNLELSCDIVLQSKDNISLNNIFKNRCSIKKEIESIDVGSVGIIPNEKIIIHGQSNQIYETYDQTIKYLLDRCKKIYILRHSAEDLPICAKIKAKFKDNAEVVLLDMDYNCIELQKIIEKFDFVVASRYHAVVHSYKKSVPAIVLGWATKYKELMNMFEQELYHFDVRDGVDATRIIDRLDRMVREHKSESKTISLKLKDKCNVDIFKRILDVKE